MASFYKTVFRKTVTASASFFTLTSFGLHENTYRSFCESEANHKESSPWQTATSLEGHTYYYNTDTGESRWSLPKTEVWPPESKWNTNWDNRNDSDSKVIHQIVMIRHGQYTTVTQEDGTRKEALTEVGRLQTAVTGERLDYLLQNKLIAPIKKVFYSTMPRATETSQIIQSKLISSFPETKFEPCSMIREGAVCYPDPPYRGIDWKPSKTHFETDHLRAIVAFKTYFRRASRNEKNNYSTVLVTHGNIIRFLVMRILQLPEEAWLRLSVQNASITIVEIRGDGSVSLKCLGDTGHFTAEHVTDNQGVMTR